MPSEVSDLLRFNFCVWTQAQSRAIDLGKWAAAARRSVSTADLLEAVTPYAGLDLGQRRLDGVREGGLLDDGRVAVKARFWTPRPRSPGSEPAVRGMEGAGSSRSPKATRPTTRPSRKRSSRTATTRCARVAYDPKFASQMAQYLMGQRHRRREEAAGLPAQRGDAPAARADRRRRTLRGNNAILNVDGGNFVVRHGRTAKSARTKMRRRRRSTASSRSSWRSIRASCATGQTRKSVYDDDDAEIFTYEDHALEPARHPAANQSSGPVYGDLPTGDYNNGGTLTEPAAWLVNLNERREDRRRRGDRRVDRRRHAGGIRLRPRDQRDGRPAAAEAVQEERGRPRGRRRSPAVHDSARPAESGDDGDSVPRGDDAAPRDVGPGVRVHQRDDERRGGCAVADPSASR
jgi:hypothetical protein